MERKIELTALIAILGIATSSSLVQAAEPSKKKIDNGSGMLIAEKKVGTGKKGGSSACGKGSCGTDAKGAAAAKKRHAKPATKKGESAAKPGAATDNAKATK